MANAPKLIGEFLSELAESQDLLNAYLEDPDKAMKEFGLSDAQRDTMLSNDLGRIRDAIREEYHKAEILVFPLQHILAQQHITASDDQD